MIWKDYMNKNREDIVCLYGWYKSMDRVAEAITEDNPRHYYCTKDVVRYYLLKWGVKLRRRGNPGVL